jgi:hypothetical protein
MFSRKADGPLSVQIPVPAEDRPAWTKVAVIAAIGFVVGIAWPKLVGVRLGPSVPEASSAAAAASAPAVETVPSPSASPSAPAVPVVAATPAPAPVASAPPPLSVTVGRGVVFACKTADGDTLKGGECGSLPGLDSIVMPRLRKLDECAEAASMTGKVHFVVHLDFPRGGLALDLGRHGVSSPDALLACAKADLAGAGVTGVQHENPRYSVAYTVTFAGGSGGAASASAQASPSAAGRTPSDAADGAAQVVWEVAIVRDAPKTGKVIARLQRGAELHIGAPKDGWYPVKYGDGFASDGWVYRGAIGK